MENVKRHFGSLLLFISLPNDMITSIHSLPDDEILDRSTLKVFADDKLNVTKKKINFVLGRVENIVGKGENAGYQHFLLFPQCFQKASFSGSLKVEIMWERVKDWRRNIFSKACWNKRKCLLTLSRRANFRLLQTERVCRRHFQN